MQSLNELNLVVEILNTHWIIQMVEKKNYNELLAYVQTLEEKVYKGLRTELINKTLFDIANSLNSTKTLQELYRSIHDILKNLMDMTNFFIGIYYKDKNAIRFVYRADKNDHSKTNWTYNFTENRSLTGDVILARKPLLKREDELKQLASQGQVRGAVPKIWLGVPLMIKGKVLGVMAVQSYDDPQLFSESDVEILSFVSDQIALSIEKKKAQEQLEKTQEKLIQTEKLEAIGTLAGGIAHDFNNTLSITLGNINLAQIISKNAEMDQLLTDAETSVMQAKELASKFIVFSKGGIILKKKIITETFLRQTLESISIEYSIPYDLNIIDLFETLEVDPQQIKEAIKNIIINAHEAMEKNGIVYILVDKHPDRKGVLKISIEDKGKGISKNNFEKIFEPYFSTKALGKDKGIGLGLSIAYSIIKSHQGDVQIDSKENQGTKVDIILPDQQKKDISNEPKPLESKKETNPELQNDFKPRILVMDDDNMIRDISEKMLNKMGFEPFMAQDGEEAIQVYKEQQNLNESINVVILDLEVKQGMGGAQTIKKLLKINPDIKAIIASGYSGDSVMENSQNYGFSLALSKPYSMKSLKKALEKLI